MNPHREENVIFCCCLISSVTQSRSVLRKQEHVCSRKSWIRHLDSGFIQTQSFTWYFWGFTTKRDIYIKVVRKRQFIQFITAPRVLLVIRFHAPHSDLHKKLDWELTLTVFPFINSLLDYRAALNKWWPWRDHSLLLTQTDCKVLSNYT